MLEYHSGIVILTTNRVRTIDDAFRSRVSLALKYQDLDYGSRKMLWEQFLLRADASLEGHETSSAPFDFTLQDIDTLAQKEINGRVIKHVVRTSQALAFSDGERISPGHVRRVWRILDAFEDDLSHTACM
ncbi:hypothetical protein RSOLAG1IB_12502 [Rhizoctonia solani AG-1 IB]|uniref:ATPase AAA-type core domain-containing protein n=1 Tax=Thanatephorus cucumeris (strain AG1-IB / isolate 7/3/14) TaxID=1108050 RepID=A0A0B7G122_THACB|nr:hypothetical protein RSOLAG1IB_12502 [Rhizoctonia solani AG-1 IB]